MPSLLALTLVAAHGTLAEVVHPLAYMPFSWDRLPRYTFCVNSSGLFSDEFLAYVAPQDIFLNNPALTRAGGSMDHFEARAAAQAAALRAVNPKQRQWFYYAIDLLRPHSFENDHYVDAHEECQLRDEDGVAVPRRVWDFGSECGVERWLNTSRMMITQGGLDGIFIDGFQGCNPFIGDGCARVCTSTTAKCDPDVMKKWNEGLVAAMWRLKREILGENGTLICNYTPGPFVCDPNKPVSECPCDGTNDERGGGNYDHMESIDAIDAAQEDYLMLTHTPHADVDNSLLESIIGFLVAAEKYQYHGSGFGYECGKDGWARRSDVVEHAYSAPLGEPLAPAAETDGCRSPEAGSYCVRTRQFATGTKVYKNYTSSAACLLWADGKNVSIKGRWGSDGCDESAAWIWPTLDT